MTAPCLSTVSRVSAVAWLLVSLASCSGEFIGGAVMGPDGQPVVPGAPGAPATRVEPPPLPLESGARRLSRRELLTAITRLTGVDVATELPSFDVRTLTEGAPKTFFFDTGFAWQTTSLDSLLTFDELARGVAGRVTATPQRMEQVLGCRLVAGRESECLGAFLDRAGRLALRRPLEAQERQKLLDTALAWAQPPQDAPQGYVSGPHHAVTFLLRVLLQHPEFLHVVEDGTPSRDDAEVMALSDTAVATRLSLLLWGELPDDALLDAALAGELHTSAQVRAHDRLLKDPRARERSSSAWPCRSRGAAAPSRASPPTTRSSPRSSRASTFAPARAAPTRTPMGKTETPEISAAASATASRPSAGTSSSTCWPWRSSVTCTAAPRSC
jgi:hypothetical protein